MKSLLKDKGAYSLGDLQGIVLLLVVIGVLFGAGLYVLSEFTNKLTDTTDGTARQNQSLDSVKNVTSGIGDLAGWIPIIVIVIAAAIVIGIVIRSFAQRAM